MTPFSLRVASGVCMDHAVDAVMFTATALAGISSYLANDGHAMGFAVLPSRIFGRPRRDFGNGIVGDGPLDMYHDIDHDGVNNEAIVIANTAPGAYTPKAMEELFRQSYFEEYQVCIHGPVNGAHVCFSLLNPDTITYYLRKKYTDTPQPTIGTYYYLFGLTRYARELPGWLVPPWYPEIERFIKYLYKPIPYKDLEYMYNVFPSIKYDYYRALAFVNNLTTSEVAVPGYTLGLKGTLQYIPVVFPGVPTPKPLVGETETVTGTGQSTTTTAPGTGNGSTGSTNNGSSGGTSTTTTPPPSSTGTVTPSPSPSPSPRPPGPLVLNLTGRPVFRLVNITLTNGTRTVNATVREQIGWLANTTVNGTRVYVFFNMQTGWLNITLNHTTRMLVYGGGAFKLLPGKLVAETTINNRKLELTMKLEAWYPDINTTLTINTSTEGTQVLILPNYTAALIQVQHLGGNVSLITVRIFGVAIANYTLKQTPQTQYPAKIQLLIGKTIEARITIPVLPQDKTPITITIPQLNLTIKITRQ